MQSQLKQARNESIQLQSQSEQARGELGKAQASARELSDEAAKLQAQLEQAKGEVANAKADAEKASGEVAKLQAQLEQAKSEAADAKANAEKASDEVAKLQAQFQAQPKPAGAEPVRIRPPAANSKEMPLSVSFRKPLVGDGKAVVLQNTSSNTLSVNVKFTDPTSSTNQVYHLMLNGGAIKELGSVGAWKLAPGDKIEIESADYTPIIKTTP